MKISRKIFNSIAAISILTCCSTANAAISDEGYFYSAKWTVSGTTFLKGAFSTLQTCNEHRTSAWSGSDGYIPDAAHAGCTYIYENEIGLANELYSLHIDPIFPILSDVERVAHVQKLKTIMEAYNVQQLSIELNNAISEARQNTNNY
ncbi:hypothetical protein GCM10007978_34730 [Shewanella hanedai]|uniref:DUF3015 domain-containing protein n=1 Tax=Shewanella hanedai TaxID=25 RepID=A0A553JJT2_SHEHA|nr:hypothetical protein [Shewanella hanedai]TRY12699.1 hypothetical protein FN961_19175 [Shewanella hanedai]GGI94190.1 hypothetical protein GCM10007978_34730 [Shewanella hanedai]